MTFLTDAEREKIAEAIKAAETKTSGELVTVIAQAADRYRYIPLLWPALIALVLPGILLVVVPELAATEVYLAQIALFVVLELILLVSLIRMAVVPKSVKNRRASRLAREQFFEQGLHLTQDRTGVLIFVSTAERYVEILADAGINQKVPPGTWDTVVAEFVKHVRAGRIADGFLGAIAAVGEILVEHFPSAAGDVNELPNHLIEI